MSSTPWVCGSCRSINQPRDNRCYHCRTPRELVEANPDTLIVAGAGSRPVEEVKPVGTYEPTGEIALLTQILIGAAMVVTVIANLIGADVVGRVLDDGSEAATTSSGTLLLFGGLGLALGGAALVAWSYWLSRVVANVPALGLGWPNVTPNAAIFESLIPVVNLYRVPAILRDVMNRLEDAPTSRSEALIAAAWLALVAGVLLPRLGRAAVSFLVGSIDDFASLSLLVGQLALGLTVAGGIFLIMIIRWIEVRMAQRAAELPAPSEPSAGRAS